MFSWSTSRKNNGYPANRVPVAQTVQGTIRPPDYTRQQHLDSYRNDTTLQRSTRKVSADDSTYDTVFQTTAGDALILRVHLPPSQNANAACRAPQMTLVGVRATHSWLDNRMKVVGFAAIQSDAAWSQARLLLGHAVHEVVKHLQLNPPNILEMTDPGLSKLQSSMGSKSSANSAAASAGPDSPPDYDTLLNSLTPPPPVDMPSIPNQFPNELDSMSREELQKLLDDELEFLSLLQKLPATKEMQLQRSSLLEENAKIATSILEREEEYKMLHGDVTDLKKRLEEKVQEFDKFKKEQDEIAKPPDIRKLKHDLNRARKESLDDSEEYAAEYVESGGTDVTTFVKEFVAKRNLMHARAAKLERLENGGYR